MVTLLLYVKDLNSSRNEKRTLTIQQGYCSR